MTARRVSVTTSKRAAGEVAEVFTTAVVGWLHLDSLGIVEQVRKRFYLQRKDGCCGQELFGLLFFATMSGLGGQRSLQRAAAHCKAALADVMGSRSFRSQSSMSRALKSVTSEQSREFCDWLLGESLAVDEFERDRSTFHLDTFGEPWRMVDFDGRVHAIRNRALPQDEDSPEPVRRSSDLARPGYPGRKRGEVQYHRMVVQDAGSSRYLGVRLGPGNGDHRDDVSWAVDRIAAWADRLGVPRKSVCARFDGKAAGVPALVECERVGISYLTRWIEYRLLEQPEVRSLLERGNWQPVADSGSGPRREALELGNRMLGWDSPSEDDEGESQVLQARLVVSRYRLEKKRKRGCGKQIGDYVYELYISTLPSSSWPAAELVEAYYGRVVEENRFGQTDSEQGCQKIVSWHLPGQELANAVSLFVWNLRLVWGANLAGWKPMQEPEPRPRQPRVTTAERCVRDEVGPAEPKPSSPSNAVSPEEQSPVSMTPTDLSEQDPGSGEDVVRATKRTRRYIDHGLIAAEFVAGLRWSTLLARLPGWLWNSEEQELRCPAGEPMRWRGARQQGLNSLALEFRVARGRACRLCVLRSGCTKSNNPRFVKDLCLTVTVPDLPSLLQKSHVVESSTEASCLLLYDEPPENQGPWATSAPSLIPSVLRRQLGIMVDGCRLRVDSPRPSILSTPPPWFSTDANERQHRRKSYGAREASCLLPRAHPLTVHVDTPRRRGAAALRNIVASAPTKRKHGASG